MPIASPDALAENAVLQLVEKYFWQPTPAHVKPITEVPLARLEQSTEAVKELLASLQGKVSEDELEDIAIQAAHHFVLKKRLGT
ncbi:hypothetical protein DIPPA_24339 [Diplonema papillatum]|nr:hypothetical protein DIPPA_24339 [Diplonema papillatum]